MALKFTAQRVLQAKLGAAARPILQPLVSDRQYLEELVELERRVDDTRAKRVVYSDIATILGQVERLLLGEYVARPIRSTTMHVRQLQVMALAVGALLQPDKRWAPASGSERYNDSARQRIAQWFWASTFGPPQTGYGAVQTEATALASWSEGKGQAPETVRRAQIPSAEWLEDVAYQDGWRYRAVLALLARNNPRDLLTGQRIDVERAAGAGIHGHHLFPRRWAERHAPDIAAHVNSVVNIAAITSYTNLWIRDQAPEKYTARIEELGVSRQRLAELLADHYVVLDHLHSARWEAFYARRARAIHALIKTVVGGEAIVIGELPLPE